MGTVFFNTILITLIVPSFSTERISKHAIVTLFMGRKSHDPHGRYFNYLEMFVKSLRRTGFNGNILVLAPKGVCGKLIDDVRALGTILVEVTVLEHKGRSLQRGRVGAVLTKLNVWRLTDYEKLIYYDSDVVFLKNPWRAFQECTLQRYGTICATGDVGLHREGYFNSGFMVLKPDLGVYNQLLTLTNNTRQRRDIFVDQDILNQYFGSNWYRLPGEYNLLHLAEGHKYIFHKVIAIHEKLEILMKMFPDRAYVWNNIELSGPKQDFSNF